MVTAILLDRRADLTPWLTPQWICLLEHVNLGLDNIFLGSHDINFCTDNLSYWGRSDITLLLLLLLPMSEIYQLSHFRRVSF